MESQLKDSVLELGIDPDSVVWKTYVKRRFGEKGLSRPFIQLLIQETQEVKTGKRELEWLTDGSLALPLK